ncbi:relaxase/mobilization nuclease domain-containing protein [Roseivivax lentus]|nr:relaxase/mobilization nuclease domain-containing protein [Roseivivax lentus]
MNDRDNDHVTVLQIRGFVADNLHGALSEARAISTATRCKQFMFSLSLNPPSDHVASEQGFIDAANRAEQALGLGGQPRAVIIHEKEGRRHAHVVWSRINVDEMKAINLPHYKNRLRDVSRDLFLDHGWPLPDGLAAYGNKNPLNFTLAEWQQAKRQDIDPREIKQAFQEAWTRSDTLRAFSNALEEKGYFLAKGDRRGFVALDVNGDVFFLPRLIGEKAKTLRDKLGSPDQLQSVAAVRETVRSKVTQQLLSFIDQTKAKHRRDTQPLLDARAEMKAQHMQERQRLKEGQDKRWQAETKERQERLNKGLRGLFDRLTGKNSKNQRAERV